MATKKDRILKLLKNGVLTKAEMAEVVGCSPQYVRTVEWRKRNKAYNADWMRGYRKDNPDAYAGELEAQRVSLRKRYAADAGYRAHVLDIARAWRNRNRRHLRAYHRAYRRQRAMESTP